MFVGSKWNTEKFILKERIKVLQNNTSKTVYSGIIFKKFDNHLLRAKKYYKILVIERRFLIVGSYILKSLEEVINVTP